MIIGVIQEPTVAAIAARLAVLPPVFDCVELRLDACERLDVDALGLLASPVPVLYTLRPAGQGGRFAGSEEERFALLQQLAALGPDYMDMEYSLSRGQTASLMSLSEKTRFILSYHDFSETPASFAPILSRMRQTAPGCLYKLAFMAHSLTDTLRLLHFCKDSPVPVVGISMGGHGSISRILAPVIHEGFTYCPVTDASAPGQMDAQTLCDVYNFSGLDRQTRLYCLLGNPVSHSVGHVFHNARNKAAGTNALYVKCAVGEGELPAALPLLVQLGFSGMSVTMPLKEAVLPLLDGLDADAARMRAVNTLLVRNGQISGYNTDAAGALQALRMPLEGKTVVILGAGGAAKAIAYAVNKEAARTIVLNRTVEKARPLGEPYPLTRLETLADFSYDCLINTLPASAPLPLSGKTFLPGSTVMDITYSARSGLLDQAEQAGCVCVNGIAMFEAQAVLQRKLWGLE